MDRPKRDEPYDDRATDCEAAIEPLFYDVMETARKHGWRPGEIRKAMFRLVAASMKADEELAALSTSLAILRAMQKAAR